MKKYVDSTKLNEFATKLHAKQKTIFALKAELGSPLVASTAAGMTDQTKVYVYVGEETGYTAGNWYYYNGSAWVSGGVYNSTAFETDDTLAVPGMAADAKIVGDLIDELEDKALITRGQVPQTDDIDTYITPGQWYASANTPTHWPFSGKYGRLIVLASTSSSLYTKVQIVISQDRKMAIRVGGNSNWSEFAIISDNSALLDKLDAAVKGLSHTEEYVPVYEWEQGAFSTANWSKGASTASNYTKYIRFADYPDLTNVMAIKVTVPQGYKLYYGCYGWSTAKTTEVSTTIYLDESDRTKLNLSLYHGNSAILPSEGSGVEVHFIPYQKITTDAVESLKTAVNGLKHTESYTPTYQWEQGAFTTSSWTKGADSASNYTKYIRFADYPDLTNIAAIQVTVPEGYKLYYGCYGWSTAKTTESSTTIYLSESDRTKLNISLYHGGSEILPSEGSGVGVRFIPCLAKDENEIDAIKKEVDGIFIADETTPIKVGIYGASIVSGYGVSDKSQHSDGDLVDLTDIGYSSVSFHKYTGTLSWPNKLKSYLETNFTNVSVENWAISGVRADNYYTYLKLSQENDNSPLDTNVDIAIIMMGNNGRTKTMAENIQGFEDIINLFLLNGATVYFLTPTAAFNTVTNQKLNTYQIMQCCKVAAKNTGISSVDAFHWIEDYCEQNGISLEYDENAEKNFLNSDNLHPGDLGHEVIFKAVKNLLKV